MLFEKVSIGLAVLEIVITMIKTHEIKKKRKATTLSAFIVEAAIGVALTVNAVLVLQGRKTHISSYPTCATVLVVLYEVSALSVELLLFIPYFKNRIHANGDKLESNGHESKDREVQIDQDSVAAERDCQHLESGYLQGSMHESIGKDNRDIEAQLMVAMLKRIIFWASICVGIGLYIAIARRNLPREGDFGVELTTLIAFGFAEFALLFFFFPQTPIPVPNYKVPVFFLAQEIGHQLLH